MATPPVAPPQEAASAPGAAPAQLRYTVATLPERWVLLEDKVPESRPHDRASELFHDQLEARLEASGRQALVARNLAVRWDPSRPQVGVDPDVCLIEPAPPERNDIESLCVWKPGHRVPRLALEIVSRNHPHKDYAESPDKYAACGCEELVVFDPLLAGPRVGGGPHLLQVWRRDNTGTFVRVHAGPGPARSTVLDAWLHVRDGKHLRAADDEAGNSWWRTREEAGREREQLAQAGELAAREAERLAQQREHVAHEREQKARERIAELESELARRRGG